MRKFKGGDASSELQKTIDDLKYFYSIGFRDSNLTALKADPSIANPTLLSLMETYQRLTGEEFTSFSQVNNRTEEQEESGASIRPVVNPVDPVVDPVDTRPKAPNSRIPTLDLLDPIVPPQSNGTCPGGYVLQDGECKLRMPSSLILRQIKHYNQISPALLDEYNRNRGSFASSDDRRFFEKLVKAFESSTGFTLNSYRQLQSYTSPYEDLRGIRRPTDQLIQDLVAKFAEFKQQTGIPFVYARQIDKLLDRRTGPDTNTLGAITGPSEYNVSGGRRKHKTRKSSRRHRR